MDDLKIEHARMGDLGAWFIERQGNRVGELVYRATDPKTITILHTEVGPELRGKAAGLKLVQAAVEWARAHEKKIIAECPYAKATIEKHAEMKDVLAG